MSSLQIRSMKKFKALAAKKSRDDGLKHSEALEALAREAGYENFFCARAALTKKRAGKEVSGLLHQSLLTKLEKIVSKLVQESFTDANGMSDRFAFDDEGCKTLVLTGFPDMSDSDFDRICHKIGELNEHVSLDRIQQYDEESQTLSSPRDLAMLTYEPPIKIAYVITSSKSGPIERVEIVTADQNDPSTLRHGKRILKHGKHFFYEESQARIAVNKMKETLERKLRRLS